MSAATVCHEPPSNIEQCCSKKLPGISQILVIHPASGFHNAFHQTTCNPRAALEYRKISEIKSPTSLENESPSNIKAYLTQYQHLKSPAHLEPPSNIDFRASFPRTLLSTKNRSTRAAFELTVTTRTCH